MRCLRQGLRHAAGRKAQNSPIANSIYTALDTNPAETSHALLDRLTRLDQARKALEQELIREQDGQEAEVHRAHQHLLRVMDEVGLTVTF